MGRLESGIYAASVVLGGSMLVSAPDALKGALQRAGVVGNVGVRHLCRYAVLGSMLVVAPDALKGALQRADVVGNVGVRHLCRYVVLGFCWCRHRTP